jgi:hypothetical protein
MGPQNLQSIKAERCISFTKGRHKKDKKIKNRAPNFEDLRNAGPNFHRYHALKNRDRSNGALLPQFTLANLCKHIT